MRMTKPKSFFRVFTETGPLIVLAVAVALLVGIVGPASAQFFNFGGPPQQRSGGWFGGDLFAPFQQPAPKRVIREDFSKAPAPEKRDNVPESNVLVLGDAMADWLAYGLEDAYAEQPDMGVIRRHKTVSGLIRYQPKGDPADWPAAAKGILATEKPDAIVVMLGLNDRVSMREPVVEKSDPKSTDKKNDKKDAKTKPDAKPADAKSTAKPDNAMDAAGKAGITYVHVWDGFVDEAGRFLQKGPDFEGQIRQLRAYDGVFFTKPGARKLAHYVEREITRLLAARSAPIELPSEPATPDANALPGQPAPRPLAGPIVPLVASSVGTDQLLGGPGSRPAAVDALAARTLVKGEPLAPPAGRADDFVWPRREVRREWAKGETPVASTSRDGSAP